MANKKFSEQAEQQFWAEINAKAEQDNEKCRIFYEQQRNAPCLEEKWIKYMKKKYPNMRVERGLIIYDETSYRDF